MDDLTLLVKTELSKISANIDAGLTASKVRDDEIRADLLQLQQRAARAAEGGGGSAFGSGQTPGQALTDILSSSESLRALIDRKAKRAVLELPGDFFSPRAAITNVPGGLPLPYLEPGIVRPVQRKLTIRDLIPAVPVTSGVVQYLRELSYTNNAAPVSEGSLKPESGMTFALVTAAVSTLAHFVKASLQVLSDTPILAQYIDQRMRYGLAFVEEQQLLLGSGVGNNIAGLMTLATAYNRTVALDSKADALRRAITQLQSTEYSPSGMVLHPFDFEVISLLKDSQGRYLVTPPTGTTAPSLWELPIVVTAAMVAGQFLVADFPQAALIFDRMQARVDVSAENVDDFERNSATLRCEERLGMAVIRPGALVKGNY